MARLRGRRMGRRLRQQWRWLRLFWLRARVPAPRHSLRIPELDALRGVAAMGVLLYHYTSIYPRLIAHQDFSGIPRIGIGYFGVELFFMISGFVIFFSAARSRSFKDFVFSRFSRLFPAYWGAVLIATGVQIAAYGNASGALLRKAAVNLTMVQTFLGVDNLDASYWTLAYELSFYALIICALRMTVAKGRRIEIALMIWLATATFVRALDIHIPYRLTIAGLLDYGQFFVFGVAFFVIYSRKADWMTYLVAAWALLMSAFGADSRTQAAGFDYYFLLSSTCAAIIVYSVLCKPRILTTSLLQFLGRISYSLYLTHSTIGFLVINRVLAAGGNDLLAVGAASAISIAAGYLLNITVEVPGRIVLSRWLALHRPSIPGPVSDTVSVTVGENG